MISSLLWSSTFLCGVLPFALLLQHVCAISDTNRVAELKKLSSSSRGHLISAKIPQLRTYLEDAPRSYNLIVMFSADPSLCQPCGKMREQLRIVSSDFQGASKRKASSSPTFFIEVKLSTSDTPFLQSYGIQHVPILYHFGAGKSKTYPKRLDEKSPNSFNLPQLGYHSNAIKLFVNERTGSKMHVIRGGYEIPFVQTVRKLMPYFVSIGVMFAAVAITTGAYKSPMLWFALVVLVYIFSVGGGHYSWIHNTPLVVVDKSGRMQYIAGGSRSQYVAEGFFVSFTCVCISGLVIAIQELPTFISHKSAQTALGSTFFLLTIGAIGALLMLYQMKMPQYLQYSEM